MKPKAYIETSIVSYLTAWRSGQSAGGTCVDALNVAMAAVHGMGYLLTCANLEFSAVIT